MEITKKFLQIFNDMARFQNRWSVWSDFVAYAASFLCSLPPNDLSEVKKTKEYLRKRYSEADLQKFGELFQLTVDSLEANPNQDFLGNLYMQLDMGNDHLGQTFSPYSIAALMSALVSDKPDTSKEIELINDCCCGAGCLLISKANWYREQGINYQKRVLFVAQDIDMTAAKMCLIQLSLLGCMAVVIVGDTLLNPPTSLFDNPNSMYTPLLCMNLAKIQGAMEKAS